MSSLKQLSKIDQRTKLKVYGWIREAEKKLKLDFLPMISNIIILYVRDDEVFDVISEDVQLSNNNKCLTKINSKRYGCGSYGRIVIPSQSGIFCQWDIKVLKLGNTFRIGISSCLLANETVFHQIGNHYVLYSDSWKWSHTTATLLPQLVLPDADLPSFKEGDVVSIYLDLRGQNGKLSIAVDDGNKYIAYSNIKRGEDISYRLMVIPKSINDSVEIIGFRKI